MKKFYLFLFILVLTSFFIYFYRLSTIPPGLSNDEVNIGYEAWSLATTGKDQWGRPWPLTFEGFGNWSLPVYIYLTASLIRLFGQTAFAVRLLSTVSGVTIVILTYFVVRRLRPRSQTVALASSALVASTPWVIGLSRIATEAPLAMAFFMARLYFGHSGVTPSPSRGNDRISTHWKILLSGFLTLASVFTYYGMWVFVPMYGFVLWFFSRKQFSVSRLQLATIGVIGLIGIILISIKQGGVARLQQVNLAGNPTIIGMLNEERGACERVYPSPVCRLVFNRATRYGSEFVRNYLSHFSFREWFLTNDAKGILPPGGYLFPILTPLFAFGIFQLMIKGTRDEKVVLFSWLFLAPIADSLTGAGNFTRAFPMAIIIPIIASYGLLGIGKRLGVLVVLGLLGAFGQFVLLYTSYFPVKHSPFTHYEYLPLVSALKEERRLPIFISSAVRDTKQYMFYLWNAKIPPRYFQESARVVREPDLGGWVWMKQVDNWHFVKKLPELSELPDESLLVGALKEEITPYIELLETCDRSSRIIKTIDYLNGDPAFAIIRIRNVGETSCLVQ